MKLFKKLLKLGKILLVGIIWSYVYIRSTLFLFKSVWSFNYLSQAHWKVINTYWNEGGKISTGKDYLFVLCLLLLIPLWLWGWRRLCRTNFLSIILSPVTWYQKREAENYIKSMSRIKIHNIGISVGEEVKQDFENKLKKQQTKIENASKTSENIRSQIKNKLSRSS